MSKDIDKISDTPFLIQLRKMYKYRVEHKLGILASRVLVNIV